MSEWNITLSTSNINNHSHNNPNILTIELVSMTLIYLVIIKSSSNNQQSNFINIKPKYIIPE